MINFFRKTRKKLADDNRFFKYWRYAIGEIVLVVVGILIALQINNINEERKAKLATFELMAKAQKELLYNIKRANRTINYYSTKDSLVYNVIKKKVTYEDYKSIWWYRELAMDHVDVRAVDDDFLFLLEYGSIISPQQESLITGLKRLYSVDKKAVENWDNYTKVLARDFKDKIKEEYNWFSDLRAEIMTDEMIKYFLHDPYYLNVMYDVSVIGYTAHLKAVVKFRYEAGHLYEDISDYLGIEKDSLVVRNHDDFNHYLGSYQNFRVENYFMDIKKDKDNILIYSEYLKDSLIYTSPIYPYSRTLFFRTSDLLYPVHLIIDEKNNIEEINFGGSYGDGEDERPKFKKID